MLAAGGEKPGAEQPGEREGKRSTGAWLEVMGESGRGARRYRGGGGDGEEEAAGEG